jgi:hypothetical protein
LLHGESFELFSAAIRSRATRDPYERKLLGFLKTVNQTPNEFAQFAKENPSAAEKKIIPLPSQDRLKIEKGEVTAGTVQLDQNQIQGPPNNNTTTISPAATSFNATNSSID